MEISQALNHVIGGQDLSAEQMQKIMTDIMTGKATDAQIGGFLVALRMKGESVNEIQAAAQVMRSLATPVDLSDEHLVDTCGTGGDGASTFNVSTASAIVAAAAGAKVAKHGNRSVSSKSGSADVLEAAGVSLALTPQQVAQCVNEVGVGFMFAPAHHGAMKYAIGPRKEMAIRTIFNLLGPLTNPAGVKKQVMGVFDKRWLEPLCKVLQGLGSEHVLLVHAADGMDEFSIGSTTYVAELQNGNISQYEVKPEDVGLQSQSTDSLKVSSAEESLALINELLDNKASAARDMVILNAGAVIYAADVADSLPAGVKLAQSLIESGAAKNKLAQLIKFSQELSA